MKARPQTLTEKLLSLHSKSGPVFSGDIAFFSPSSVMVTDATFPLVERALSQLSGFKIKPEKIVLVNDHFVPARDIKAADVSRRMREFARIHEVANFFEVGRSGISHVLLPNQGITQPNMFLVGADSHTVTNGTLGAFAIGVGSTDAAIAMAYDEIWLRVPEAIQIRIHGKPGQYVTGKDVILTIIQKIGIDGARYKSMEFTGEGLRELSLEDRFTLCNMSAEAGAKAGIIEADDVSRAFVLDRCRTHGRSMCNVADQRIIADADAQYSQIVDIDLSAIKPVVALPPSPDNVANVEDVKTGKIDQVVIGSCTNGRISDFRAAAKVLAGKRAAPGTRLVIIPGDQEILLQMTKEGLSEVFLSAGGVITPPSCGACIGGSLGVLGDGEVGVFTTSRNFVGRSGASTSQIYLVNPWVAAATAISGKLTLPNL